MPEITGPTTVDSPFTRFGELIGLRPVTGDTSGGLNAPINPQTGTVGQLVGDLATSAATSAAQRANQQGPSVQVTEQWRADP